MHLKSLRIHNFRMLERLEVKKLGHVNLIVGRNNCGKSTVLEALRIYAGSAHRELLEKISSEHDEKYKTGEYPRDNEIYEPPFKHFFTGRKFPEIEEEAIYIGEIQDESRSIKIEHIYFIEEMEEYINPLGETRLRSKQLPIPKSSVTSNDSIHYRNALSIRASGTTSRLVDLEPRRKGFRPPSPPYFDRYSCSFVSTQFSSMDELADIWDTILYGEYNDDYNDYIITALQFLDAKFEELAFVKKENTDTSTRVAIIKLRNEKRRYPLNSMGDGMRRVLQLILKAAYAQNGFLLIDELENGLHYSVQEKVWDLLFELAEKFNIQIFAATHSWDCIESFAKVANSRPEAEAVLFRLGRSIRTSDQDRIIATVFDGEKLAALTQADIEVR